MKLLELQVEGYRSLKNVTWKPGNLNVLIGPNGSGKTNLIKALELLAASAQGGLGDYVQEDGGFHTMVWDGQAKNIRFWVRASGLTGLSAFLKSVGEFPLPPQEFEYELCLGYLWQRPPAGVLVESELLRARFPSTDNTPTERQKWLERNDKAGRMAILDIPSGHLIDLKPEVVTRDEALLSMMVSPSAINPFVSDLQRGLASWTIYQDLWSRVYPGTPRGSVTTSVRMPAVTSYETQVSSDAGNLVNVLHTLYTSEKQFEGLINDAMNAAFPNAFGRLEFPPAADQLIQMRIRWRGLERGVSAANLSDGTLRFLFLITVLANPKPPSLIVIEEPEIGLHPRMMSIIAEYAVDAAERTQVVFTTHSPDFLSAFRDTIPTTTVCNWENGETVLRVLKDEDLKYWLQEYTLGEFAFSGAAEAVE
jgi:predicted ATPase